MLGEALCEPSAEAGCQDISQHLFEDHAFIVRSRQQEPGVRPAAGLGEQRRH